MEGAGKLIDDEDLREAMREKGLGTPATRAQIIEGLITEKYVYRDGRELVPTAKAFSLLTLLHGLSVPELFSPELTAEWEFKLAQMEHGKLKRDAFMREIIEITEHIVGQAKGHESDTIPGDFGTLSARCPKCGGEVHENYKKFQCQSCDFASKIMGGRQLEVSEADTLLREKRSGRSRFSQPPGASVQRVDQAHRRKRGDLRFRRRRFRRFSRSAGFHRARATRSVPEVQFTRLRAAAGVRVRKGGWSGQDLRFPVGPRDPAAPRRARADAEASRNGQDGSAAIRVGADQARLLGIPRPATGRQDRIRVRSEGAGEGRSTPIAGTLTARARATPRDKKPVELHAGRYGPYVKHGYAERDARIATRPIR